MEYYLDTFLNAFTGISNWVWKSITFEITPWYSNYFWGLILISLIIWTLEIVFPWRKNQKIFRKDFWLDLFYMFFNFFIFSIFITGFYKVIELLLVNLGFSVSSISIFDISEWLKPLQLLFFFVLNDFVQWLTHVLLHRYEFLWNFHKVHHSVKEMGFAAHLRYHWMENIFYKPLKTLVALLIVGGEPADAFIIHFIAIAIGHLNHANIKITWGVFKYLFNNPVMHLYHHVKILPKNRKRGVNFGISLSIWDYIFKTNYIPEESGTIELGWENDEDFPQDFIHQIGIGFKNKK